MQVTRLLAHRIVLVLGILVVLSIGSGNVIAQPAPRVPTSSELSAKIDEGRQAMNTGDLRKAKQIYSDGIQQAIAIHDEKFLPGFQMGLGAVLQQMAQLLPKPLPQLEEAMRYFQAALAAFLKLKQPVLTGVCYTNIANDAVIKVSRSLFTDKKEKIALLKSAEANYLQAISSLQVGQKQLAGKSQKELSYAMAAAYGLLSNVYALRDENEAALTSAEKGIRLAEQQDQFPVKGLCNLNGGNACLALGMSTKATAYYIAAAGFFMQARDVNQTTKAVVMLGASLADEEKWDNAQQALETALQSLALLPSDRVLTLYNLGIIDIRLGKLSDAQENLEKARKVLGQQPAPDNAMLAKVLDNLSNVLAERGQMDQALEMKLRGLDLQKQYGGTEGIAYSLGNLGVLYSITGKFEQAEQSLVASWELGKKGQNPKILADIAHSLGALYLASKQQDKAEQYYTEELTYANQTKDAQKIAHSLCDLGYLHEARGDSTQAQDYFSRSLRVQDDLLDNILAYSTEGETQGLLTTLPKAFDSLLLSLSRSSPSAVDLQNAFLWTQHRKAIVLNTQAEFRRQQARISSDPTLRPLQVEMIRARKHKALLSLSPTDREKATRIAEHAEIQLRRAYHKKYPQKAAKLTLNSLAKQLTGDTALIEFIRIAPVDFKNPDTPLPSRYLAFVLTSKQTSASPPTPALLDLGEADAIDEAVNSVRQPLLDYIALYKPGQKPAATQRIASDMAFKAASKRLFQKVLAPLLPSLHGAKSMLIAPDGTLNRFPFEALTQANDTYLIQDYRLSYLTSGRDLLRPASGDKHPASPPVAFIAPDFDLTVTAHLQLLKALPSVAMKESSLSGQIQGGITSSLLGGMNTFAALSDLQPHTQAIGQLIGTKPLTGSSALEETFLNVRSPRVLHVLTHGFFVLEPTDKPAKVGIVGGNGVTQRLTALSDPMLRSGIALAGANQWKEAQQQDGKIGDGWVTAAKMASMDLRGTELVTLAACETGLGDVRNGEGVYGIRRALLLAGARSLLTSLWEVPGEETATLTESFYRQLRAGKDRRESLRSAQLELLSHSSTSHPLSWAGFVLVGDTGSLNLQ